MCRSGWRLRSALTRTLASTAASGSPLVLTSADGVMARLAANDLAELGFENVLVLAGGNAGWCGAGLPSASGPTQLLTPRDDRRLASSERPGDERANVMAYLDWEASLLAAINAAAPCRSANASGPEELDLNGRAHAKAATTGGSELPA